MYQRICDALKVKKKRKTFKLHHHREKKTESNSKTRKCSEQQKIIEFAGKTRKMVGMKEVEK